MAARFLALPFSQPTHHIIVWTYCYFWAFIFLSFSFPNTWAFYLYVYVLGLDLGVWVVHIYIYMHSIFFNYAGWCGLGRVAGPSQKIDVWNLIFGFLSFHFLLYCFLFCLGKWWRGRFWTALFSWVDWMDGFGRWQFRYVRMQRGRKGASLFGLVSWEVFSQLFRIG